VGHDHAVVAAQDELVPARSCDFRVQGLREGEGNMGSVSWRRVGVVLEDFG
jgi:hypothetical protein